MNGHCKNQIKNEICSLNHIDRAFVIVRTLESPLEEIDDNYLEYNEEDYIRDYDVFLEMVRRDEADKS